LEDLGVDQKFTEHLERSVRMRMRTDVSMTSCLSGGIDSSTLVALLGKFSRANGVQVDGAISARFPDDPTIDEGPFIDRMLVAAGLAGHAVSVGPGDLARDVRRLHWHQEAVIAGPSMYLEWSVMKSARELGYTVIIDGQGADEILAGYQIYLQALQAELHHRGAGLRAYRLGRLRDRRLRRAAKGYVASERRFSMRDSLTRTQMRRFHANHVAGMLTAYGGDGVPDPDEVGALRFELALDAIDHRPFAPTALDLTIADFESWPGWNPDVRRMALEGPVAEGTTFRWKAGPGTITSTLRSVARPGEIGWTGKTVGTHAVHVWRLQPRDGRTRVTTAESFEGWLPQLLRGLVRKQLQKSLDAGLSGLKVEAERRAAG
jgi:hypothetical protein